MIYEPGLYSVVLFYSKLMNNSTHRGINKIKTWFQYSEIQIDAKQKRQLFKLPHKRTCSREEGGGSRQVIGMVNGAEQAGTLGSTQKLRFQAKVELVRVHLHLLLEEARADSNADITLCQMIISRILLQRWKTMN